MPETLPEQLSDVNQSEVLSTPSLPHSVVSSTIFDSISFIFVSVSPSPMCNTTDDCDEYEDEKCENMCEEGTSSDTDILIVVICIICVIIIIIIVILVISVIVCYKKKKFQNCGVKPAEDEKENRPTDPTPATQPSKISSHDDGFSNKTKSLPSEKSVPSKKKDDSPPMPEPYRGKSQQVSYSSSKQEVHYAEMSHHHSQKPQQHGGRGGGGGKAMSPPPMQSVVYSDIKPPHR